jgi:hypothetical protein
MLFAYARDTDAVVTVSGSDSTPSIVTDARWFNGSPQEVTVVASMFAASPSIDEFVDIDVQWTNPRAVGLLASLNLGLPAGVLVQAFGRRSGDPGFAYALGGNSTTQRTLALPGGRVQHLVLPDADIDPLIGYRLRVFCDRNGATWGDDETDVGVGELGGWSMVDLARALQGWERGRTRNKLVEFGADGGVAIYSRAERRWYKFGIEGEIDDVYRYGLGAALDWEELEALMDPSASRFICIPRWLDESGELSVELLHRTAVFGGAAFTQMQHNNGPFHRGALELQEVL